MLTTHSNTFFLSQQCPYMAANQQQSSGTHQDHVQEWYAQNLFHWKKVPEPWALKPGYLNIDQFQCHIISDISFLHVESMSLLYVMSLSCPYCMLESYLRDVILISIRWRTLQQDQISILSIVAKIPGFMCPTIYYNCEKDSRLHNGSHKYILGFSFNLYDSIILNHTI